jgi:uroporphyrinogen-III decarboxylase
VRREVRRCTADGGPSGFMLSSCNSIFPGMNPAAVREFFRYQAEWIERQPI